MQRRYSAIDLRGYPSDLFISVCTVVSIHSFHPDDTLQGVMIESIRQLNRIPKGTDVIFARGGTSKRNRKFLESKKISVLSRPYPLDSVQARLAAEHHVGLELCFHEIARLSGYVRARVLTSLQQTIALAQKYHAPLVITSGSSSPHEVKSPRTLVAFGKILGLTYPEAKAALWNIPKTIIEEVI
jgi:ribonuclease P/MRP protein subunit RPP1